MGGCGKVSREWRGGRDPRRTERARLRLVQIARGSARREARFLPSQTAPTPSCSTRSTRARQGGAIACAGASTVTCSSCPRKRWKRPARETPPLCDQAANQKTSTHDRPSQARATKFAASSLVCGPFARGGGGPTHSAASTTLRYLLEPKPYASGPSRNPSSSLLARVLPTPAPKPAEPEPRRLREIGGGRQAPVVRLQTADSCQSGQTLPSRSPNPLPRFAGRGLSRAQARAVKGLELVDWGKSVGTCDARQLLPGPRNQAGDDHLRMRAVCEGRRRANGAGEPTRPVTSGHAISSQV